MHIFKLNLLAIKTFDRSDGIQSDKDHSRQPVECHMAF